jgi:putative membrane protein
VGFATFGQNPELLAGASPRAVAFYGAAFRFFAIGQVWLAFAVFALMLTRRAGTRWIPAFGALYLISLLSELSGTTLGIPFGSYSYSTLLSPMWLGHVPVVIPLSWFYMAVPSYLLATSALGSSARTVWRVGLASLILLSWDLALDPAMSHATRYWLWEGTGPYYGMPWLNLFGWYVTGLALSAALAGLDADSWIEKLPKRWVGGFYLINLALPVGMSAAAGLWGAIVATGVMLGSTFILLRVLSGRAAAPAQASGGLSEGAVRSSGVTGW